MMSTTTTNARRRAVERAVAQSKMREVRLAQALAARLSARIAAASKS